MYRKFLGKKSINLSLIAVFVILFSMFWGTVSVSAIDVPYDIGAFYFSNWNPELSPHMVVNTKNTYGRDNDWFGGVKDTLLKPGPWGYGPIADREPMLGWYDDRQQSVLDNQILQASSRGISHFAFYYYWKEDGTAPRPGQNVELWKTSPNKNLMNYYLYFVADGSYNSTDWRARIVPKLIEFMKEPQYKRSKSTDPSMNNRPIVGLYGDMIARLGGTNASLKVELDYLRAESIKAGVGDPILLCNGYRTLSNFMVQGYDGFQPLNLAGLDLDKHPGIPEDYASSYPPAWNEFVYKDYSGDGTGYENYQNYLFIPGGLNAFDARPWRGVASDSAGDYYYADPSPNKFKAQLNNVKGYLDTHPRSMNMATFYAWNEWGEGGSIEPNTLFGYGYIDAMQEVFGLNNTKYKVAANGINDIAPDVRVDVEPEYSEVSKGQNVVLKVRVKNYSQASVNGKLSLSQPAKNAEAIDQAAWAVKSSLGTDFTLAAGAAGEAEFVIPVGEGEDFNRHNFVVTADYGGKQNISTFVVKVPPFYGCLEKDKVKTYTDFKFDLNVKIRNYTMNAKNVNYTLDLPEGWTADKLTGTVNTAGYIGTGIHKNRTITDTVVISYLSTTVPGDYTIKLTTGDGEFTKVDSFTVNIPERFNLLYNGSFEIDADNDGMPDVWSGSGGANITVQTGTQLEPATMGNKFVKVVGTGSDVGIKQEGTKGDVNWLRIDPSKRYEVSFWAKVESGKFSVIDTEAQGDYTWIGSNSSKEITAKENGNVWKPYTLEFSPNEKAGRESLRFFVTADSGVVTTFNLDAVMLREIETVPQTGIKPVWYQNFDTGSGFTAGTNATVAIDSSSANIGGLESVKLTTSGSGDPGSSAQCVNVVPPNVTSFDASTYRYLTFYVKDTQGANTMKLTFVDANNAEYSMWTTVRSVQNQWTQVNIPLSSITGIDKKVIKEIRVGEWNTGAYYFDDFYFSADSTFKIPSFGVDKTALTVAISDATTLLESKTVGVA
ncbi:MAG TPA: glycoside hydrolase family 99-like domain-containing protein, partial [Clostridia bacterium]|nr:glycoside hydrolase family 99-like domain-containing protein [Clostridia bacterium]